MTTALAAQYLMGAELGPIPKDKLWFVQIGFGADQHGQDVTKAAMRAVKDAISFNSVTGACERTAAGSKENLRVHVRLGVPDKYKGRCDVKAVADELPYGRKSVEIVTGGLVTRSGNTMKEMGDKEGAEGEDVVVVCAAVEVGC